MKRYYKDIEGSRIWYKGVIINGDKQIFTWDEELILADGWILYIPEPIPPYQPTAKELIQQEIRERYEASDEWMINRKMNDALNPDSTMTEAEKALAKAEFEEYNEFVKSVLEKYQNE